MPSDQEIRERLKKQADEVIERVLAERKPAGENSLSDIEELAVGAGKSFEEKVLAYLAQEESQAKEEPVCEECGRRMRSRGKRKRAIVTEAGEVSVERRYYVCPKCGKKVFPPG